MKFHRVKCTYPGRVRSKLLYISQFCVLFNLIDSLEQLDLYFNTEVARGFLVNKSVHYTDCCTTIESVVSVRGMRTLHHKIIQFKENMTNLLNGYVRILYSSSKISGHPIVLQPHNK